jgi:hypothetical protein
VTAIIDIIIPADNYNQTILIICQHYAHGTLYYNIQCSLVKPPPSVQSLVWRYNEFGDKLRDIENRKLCDHMKRDNPIIIGKTNEINYNIMTSWSIMFYNINFFLFFFLRK